MKKDNRLTGSKPLMPQLDAEMTLVQLNDTFFALETSLFSTAENFYEFFHYNGYMIERSDWNKGQIAQTFSLHSGWVYGFYDHQDIPLYIGETERTFQKRFDEHVNKQWWPDWFRAKVLPCPDPAMRKVLESLVGLHGGYLANKAQPVIGVNAFDEVILSLIKLGNDAGTLPTLPNKIIYDQANMLLDLLGDEFDEEAGTTSS
jgi:hypothetical protein